MLAVTSSPSSRTAAISQRNVSFTWPMLNVPSGAPVGAGRLPFSRGRGGEGLPEHGHQRRLCGGYQGGATAAAVSAGGSMAAICASIAGGGV
jgi:hypothetical protein